MGCQFDTADTTPAMSMDINLDKVRERYSHSAIYLQDTQLMKILLACLLQLLALAAAKKGGKGKASQPDPNIVNPATNSVHPDHTAEFNEDLIEGDMVVKGANKEDRNAIGDKRKLWPNGRVPYTLDRSLSSKMRGLITQSIKDYNQYTCIRFVPRQSERNYVDINSRSSGCYAYLGVSGGKQPLNLQNRGCADKGTVIHEMLHTIGFGHEQARNDRDNYITVHWNNISPQMHSQFNKMRSEDNQGFPYDYNSVMHYPDWGFSKNGRPVITTKDRGYQKKIGQRLGFSKIDIQEVNKLYNCGNSGGGGGGGNTGGGRPGGNGGGGNTGGGGGGGGGSGWGCKNDYGDRWCEFKVRQRGMHFCTPRYSNLGTVCKKSCKKC